MPSHLMDAGLFDFKGLRASGQADPGATSRSTRSRVGGGRVGYAAEHRAWCASPRTDRPAPRGPLMRTLWLLCLRSERRRGNRAQVTRAGIQAAARPWIAHSDWPIPLPTGRCGSRSSAAATSAASIRRPDRSRPIPLGRGSSPHGVIMGADGIVWLTDGGQNAIVASIRRRETSKSGRCPKARLCQSQHRDLRRAGRRRRASARVARARRALSGRASTSPRSTAASCAAGGGCLRAPASRSGAG